MRVVLYCAQKSGQIVRLNETTATYADRIKAHSMHSDRDPPSDRGQVNATSRRHFAGRRPRISQKTAHAHYSVFVRRGMRRNTRI